MLAVLVFLLCVCLVVLVCVETLACRFYLSAYARATGRRFKETARDAHARLVYSASAAFAPRAAKSSRRRGEATSIAEVLKTEPRMFFNVAIPLEEGACAFADIVVLTASGVEVFCAQEGPGSLYGEASDDRWLFVGLGKRDGSERFVPNASRQACLAAAAIESAMYEAGEDARVRANVVWGRLLNASQAAVDEAVRVIPCTQARKTPIGFGTAGELSEGALIAVYRLVKACSNASSGSGAQSGFGAGGARRGANSASGIAEAASLGGLRETLRQAYDEATTGEIVRAADKLVNDKENFDALTWQRVLQISGELESTQDPDRIVDLAGELKLIARTNISVNYRFGIADVAAGAQLSPAGLVVQEREAKSGSRGRVAPSPELSSALEQAENSGFFESGNFDDDGAAGSRS